MLFVALCYLQYFCYHYYAVVFEKLKSLQTILLLLVKDIRNQRLHRQRRKVEMTKLKTTLKSLSQKRTFFEEQINYYNQYVKTCLDKQAAKTKWSIIQIFKNVKSLEKLWWKLEILNWSYIVFNAYYYYSWHLTFLSASTGLRRALWNTVLPDCTRREYF